MPKQRRWTDSSILDAKPVEKALRANMRDLNRELIAESIELRREFDKQQRTMETEYERRFRELHARIVQYETDGVGDPKDEAVRVAKATLKKLRADLRQLRSEHATVKLLLKSEFQRKLQILNDEIGEIRADLSTFMHECKHARNSESNPNAGELATSRG